MFTSIIGFFTQVYCQVTNVSHSYRLPYGIYNSWLYLDVKLFGKESRQTTGHEITIGHLMFPSTFWCLPV